MPLKPDSEVKGSLNKNSPPQRQRSLGIPKFRHRRSISETDLKRARRTGLLNSSVPQKIRRSRSELNSSAPTDDVQEQKCAGMQIRTTFLFKLWRKYRIENNILKKEVAELKNANIKLKNKVHALGALFNVEKNSNDELGQRLKDAIDQNRQLEESKNRLNAAFAQCERERIDAEQKSELQVQEIDALNALLKETKEEVLKVISEHDETRCKLNFEQSKNENLETEISGLRINIELLNMNATKNFGKLQKCLEAKEMELSNLEGKTKSLENKLNFLKEDFETQVRKFSSKEEKIKNELEAVRRLLAATMGERIKSCWENSVRMQRSTLNTVHWFAASVLPAVPLPKTSNPLQFSFTLEKAISVFKRK